MKIQKSPIVTIGETVLFAVFFVYTCFQLIMSILVHDDSESLLWLVSFCTWVVLIADILRSQWGLSKARIRLNAAIDEALKLGISLEVTDE